MPHDRPTPAVSVLMPVYNGERFLAEAIDSILGQTFTDFEFVIIDDGSTDASPAILADYASRDPRIRVLRQANAGIVAALNRGLAECRAPLVARMDADDISLPTRLEHQLAFLAVRPRVAVVGTAFQLVAETGAAGPKVRPATGCKALARGLRRRNCLAHPTVMMRRNVVLEAGGYREALRHAEDYDLWTRLSEAHRLANLPECLLLYRIHGGQISWAQAEAQARATAAVRALTAQRRRAGRERFPLPQKIDQAFLSSLGISKSAQEAAVIACAAGRITAFDAVKMRPEGKAARTAMLGISERASSGYARRYAAVRLAWADFVLACRDRRWLRGIRALSICAYTISTDSRIGIAAMRRRL